VIPLIPGRHLVTRVPRRPSTGSPRRRGSHLIPGNPGTPSGTSHPSGTSGTSGTGNPLPEPGVYSPVDFRADALDEALGDGIVIARTKVGVRGHRGANLRLMVAAHVRTLQPVRDRHKWPSGGGRRRR
jgi:hypothetical protein